MEIAMRANDVEETPSILNFCFQMLPIHQDAHKGLLSKSKHSICTHSNKG